MKKEIIFLIVFLLVIFAQKMEVPFASILAIVLCFSATVFLIIQTPRSAIWKRSKFLAIFATYYKILFYTAILFAVFQYPGSLFVTVFSYAVWIAFFIVANIKSEIKEANSSFLYFVFTAFVTSFFLFPIA